MQKIAGQIIAFTYKYLDLKKRHITIYNKQNDILTPLYIPIIFSLILYSTYTECLPSYLPVYPNINKKSCLPLSPQSLFLFFFLSLSLSLTFCHCHSLLLCLSLPFYLSFSHFFYISLTLSSSVSFSQFLTVFFSQSNSLCLY